MRASHSVPSGLILIDKQSEWTSHDVVAKARGILGTRKVGHAGTLDPMATGLLILGVGSATRLLTYVTGETKRYVATIRLGQTTTTDDADGERVAQASVDALRAVETEAVRTAVQRMTGPIMQVPSAVSAIKVNGQRAYARVRAGEHVELQARPVTVSAFDLLGYEPVVVEQRPVALDLSVRVDCSAGTYIRALARDLGAELGVGGHLTELRRTRIGRFSVDDAHILDDLDAERDLLSAADAARLLFPSVRLDVEQATDLRNGKRIVLPDAQGSESVPASESVPVAAIAPDGRLVGLVRNEGGRARVLVNFPVDAA